MKKICVLSGSGISQESGISTFRDQNGLWENHRIEDVASPQGWNRHPEMVLDFYNRRRAQLKEVEPNMAHKLLANLESLYDVAIITQNVDDLHERAGSKQVIHIHGELRKVRSTSNPNLIYPWEDDLAIGDIAEDGFQLRPHIVWFGEQVLDLEQVIDIIKSSDIFIIIGTSLQVFPANNLYTFAPNSAEFFLIDPAAHEMDVPNYFTKLSEPATAGMAKLYSKLTD